MCGMWNLCGRRKELTAAVNGESVRLTRSLRSLDTRPLRAFIITSICSFIACISAKTGGGVASMRDGMLTFCRFSLLGVLLPSSPSRSRRLALESSRSSTILLPVFRCSYSSKTWFCLVRRSTAAVRICTCFSRAVGYGSSSWTLLMVAIDQVTTMQLFFRVSVSCGLQHYSRFPQTVPTDDARKSTVSYTVNTCSQWHLQITKRKDLTESTGVVPAEYPLKVKLELLTVLEC